MFNELILPAQEVKLEKHKSKQNQKHFTWTTQDDLITISHVHEFVYGQSYFYKNPPISVYEEGWKWQPSSQAPADFRAGMKGHWGKTLNNLYPTIKEAQEAAYEKITPAAKEFGITINPALKKMSKTRCFVTTDNSSFINSYGGKISGGAGNWKFSPYNGSDVLNTPFFQELKSKQFKSKNAIIEEIINHVQQNLPSLYYEAVYLYQKMHKNLAYMIGEEENNQKVVVPQKAEDYDYSMFWFTCYLQPCKLEEIFPL